MKPGHSLGVSLVAVATTISFFGVFLLARPVCYQAVTRIELKSDFSESYILEKEFDIIDSELILRPAIENLRRPASWAGNQKLLRSEAIGALREQLELRPLYNIGSFEIRVSDGNPFAAAEIANAIADVYFEHKRELGIEILKHEVETLEKWISKWELETKMAEDDLNSFKSRLNLPDRDSENMKALPAYEKALANLQDKKHLAEIGHEKLVSLQKAQPKDALVITSRATPADKPVGSSRLVSTLLLVVSGILFVFGFKNLG